MLRNHVAASEGTVVFFRAIWQSFANNLGSRTAWATMKMTATQSKLHFCFSNDSQNRHRVRTSDARKHGNLVQIVLLTNIPATDVRRTDTCSTFLRATRSRVSFLVRLRFMGPLSLRTCTVFAISGLVRIWRSVFTCLSQHVLCDTLVPATHLSTQK